MTTQNHAEIRLGDTIYPTCFVGRHIVVGVHLAGVVTRKIRADGTFGVLEHVVRSHEIGQLQGWLPGTRP